MAGVRIGIDVGGTFTDAVAIDEATHTLIDHAKVPTTHQAGEGVALGIVQALGELLRKTGISAEDVTFIAHGTTQATNALLEGDVAAVGIVATAKGGIEAMRARSETQIGDLELAPGRLLKTYHCFVTPDQAAQAIRSLREQGTEAIVAAETFSVDNPAGEEAIVEAAHAEGMPATATHDISKLYGLRMRTRTAVVNASILPKMLATADLTEQAIMRTGIAAPLMIMRCDGGVMNLDEVRRRPIMTLLSGPAAGVAGALIYEKITDGLFLEVGGTSTDISAVKQGRVMVEYAEVGGNKTYVRSLDVRTIGVAGGSMARLDRSVGKIKDVGPRSAHIAGLQYAVYASRSDIIAPQLEFFAPMDGDPADYVCVRCGDRRYALTTACAANILGYVHKEDYAYGSREAAAMAFAPLADALGVTVEAAARELLRVAARKLAPAVRGLLTHYGGSTQETVLVGGGGGAAAIVPFLGESLGMRSRLARNHHVISPIGVALALVRDVVERTMSNPSQDDLMRVRKEAEEAALRSGAAQGTLSVQVEVDSVRNVVRATATGATELQTREKLHEELPDSELERIAADSIGVPARDVKLEALAGIWHVYSARHETKGLFGLMRRLTTAYRVVGGEGAIRLSATSLQIAQTTVGAYRSSLQRAVSEATVYGDAGATLPPTYILCGREWIELSGLPSYDKMAALAETSLAGYSPEEEIIILCST